MVIIEIDNSYSKVKNLTSVPFNALRKELSYSIDKQAAYFSNNHFNTTRYCIDKYGVFATGLLNRVIRYLDDNSIPFEVDDKRDLSKPVMSQHKLNLQHLPHEWQVTAAKYALDYGRAIISAPTGSGKSLTMALIIAQTGVAALVVVPSLQIKQQLTDAFKSIFKDMSNITIENIDSSALKKTKHYDLLIIDEAHHVAAKTYQKLNKTAWKGIRWRVFLTATPFRNNTEETLLFEGIAGSNVYKLSYKEAVSEGYICPIEAYYIEIPKTKTEGYTWAQVYSELVVNNIPRNGILTELMLKLSLSNKSTLCLVKEIAHGEKLSAHTGILFANGQDDDTRRFIELFNAGDIKSLIGTTGIVGEGVDTKPCEYVIICGLGKAKSAFMQAVGRCLRMYPGKASGKVIIISDRSHKFTKSHFKAQCQILLDEYGVIPLKLDI